MSTVIGEDDKARCPWCVRNELYRGYHDTEWGVPEIDSRQLFEKLILDGFQAGLSWYTILAKREAFQTAFAQFDPVAMSEFTEEDIARMLENAAIVRSRKKIENAIKSARLWLEIEESAGGFSDFIWEVTDGKTIETRLASIDDMPTQTEASQKMSKKLKAAGFGFCGPVICHAYMQAVGIYNDHLISCWRHDEVARLAR